ncbi:multicopper oxidase [Legionella waltersii]|uniref:Multicopper oxidase n=1 Tax=Legionella waltersii TaxID=66969 RepID=A0A0W1ADN3_9GAMM|nr:multicopper oxidase [Legionella waltersii]SNU97588.1 multicopper oxidase [Legionella waltersii]
MKSIIALLVLVIAMPGFAAERVINLVVEYKTVYFAGKPIRAISVNNQIPAPTLRFKQGDHVSIHVHNHLNEETAIHWHGIILPWQMDGVLGITQKGIPPGGVFHYQFTLDQSGTYWYHAHAGLQEQQGLYGALLIDPNKKPLYHYTKDYVIVLSDWSNTHADQILKNLKKQGDYYAPRFPLQPTLAKFLHDYQKASKEKRKQLLDDYKGMQQSRMSIYDLSDVAYDAFLLNGHASNQPWTAPVKLNDVVRLRFIGAGGSSIFNVKIPGIKMQMVHVEGNDIKPYFVNSFAIAPGETYDVLVKIKEKNPYIIYAESRDTLGAAVGALTTSPDQIVNYKAVPPFPEPENVSQEMMSMMMESMNHDMSQMSTSHHKMDMHHHPMANHSMSMAMPTEPSIIGDHFSPSTLSYSTSMGTKYQNMVAAIPTNDPNEPVSQVIKMELFGYMERFIWFVNGVPEYNAHPIELKPGKRYRFVFTNNSMMHHPMHIHGHWFILRKGQGKYDPMLHTIDIPPGATITADVDTDASGQWLFHCHMLYHMMTGMSRVFQYSTLIELSKGKIKPQNIEKQTVYHNRPIVRVDEIRPIDKALIKHPMAHPTGFWFASFLDIGADPFNNAQRLSYRGLYGPDYNKLELYTNEAEVFKGNLENADIDVFYWHLINQFWAVKGGANYFNKPSMTPYWQPGIGIEGLMPYFIDTNARVYFYGGSVKLDLELSRDTQLFNNFLVRTSLRSLVASKTVPNAVIGNGLNQMRYSIRPYYRLTPGLNVYVEFENEKDYGAFKSIERTLGEQTTANTVTFGLSLVL